MSSLQNIRNFCIIAHIDHGKSTLADRMLEVTRTVETRKMQEQVLDSMELERERGITIKMTPVRMHHNKGGNDYILNLIDTPGHIDFSYEVSRAQKAVEGCILLVDATQGVQAQTLSVLGMARESGLTIIPVMSKIDSPLADTDEVRGEIAQLLDCDPASIMAVSGKTGEGVPALLDAIVERIPAPTSEITNEKGARALIFDFQYSNHRGIILYIRVLDGTFKKGDDLSFIAAGERFFGLELGHFLPSQTPVDSLSAGEIGYIVSGVKRPGIAHVGDTVTPTKNPLPALAGYEKARPVVWASVFPESQDDFDILRQALLRLQLSDSALAFEEETSGTLGRGFRCGCLGMLHLEIVTERLKRENNLDLVVTTPSITYEIIMKKKYGQYEAGEPFMVYSPAYFPDDGDIKSVREPWIDGAIITPPDYVGGVTQLLFEHEAETGNTDIFGDNRFKLSFTMPLRELMRGFFDKLKSATSGYASLTYEIAGLRDADVVRMDILVAGEPVIPFTRVVSRRRIEEEGDSAVEKLYKVLPRQQIKIKIQAKALGRFVASKEISAFRKDVTSGLYGGDVSRKNKLLDNQKKGKAKMQAMASKLVHIPQDVYVKMIKSDVD
jgi:GTP-binding protein LepA